MMEMPVAFNALQTLVTGSTLTEHMERFYLNTLRAVGTTEASISGTATEGKAAGMP